MNRTRVRGTLEAIFRWLRTRKLPLALIVMIMLFVGPPSSESQIPSPCCALLSTGLSAIADALSSVIAGGLDAVNTTMRAIDVFQKTVVWPEDLINEAKAVVGALQGLFNQIRALGQVQVASATLPDTQQLEEILLSANADLIGAVDSQYRAVYSAVPPPSDASPEARDAIDMADAATQAAMKRAIAIDAIADLELEAADQIIQNIQEAAPGTAPIIEAGAAAWLVRANAYTQAALSELMRLRAIDLAASGTDMKLDAQRAAKARGNVTDALKRN